MSTAVSDPVFRNPLGETIFHGKYKHKGCATWHDLSGVLIRRVAGGRMDPDALAELIDHHRAMRCIAGGRYLYYAGRPRAFFNNCYLLRSEADTREDWAQTSWKAETCLMTGGGIGNDYSVYRAAGSVLGGTGGLASGPVPKMKMINEIGRHVRQGGSRRSAIYASLAREHGDIWDFLRCKNWQDMPVGTTGLTVADLKNQDFDYPAPLDMTNISVNYGDAWLGLDFPDLDPVFVANVRQAMTNGEPGFSFNFGAKANETLRNACTEVTSEDDSDVCNLASVNMARIADRHTFRAVCYLTSQLLLCGTLVAELPYDKVYRVRERNRRLGLGLMGVHEWLLARGYRYGMNPELREWLADYVEASEAGANVLADALGISRPVAYRAIAPTGTIGILAGTTTGIEPIYAAGYRRRYLDGGTWRHQYVTDSTAAALVRDGVDPDAIESAADLAADPARRIEFQADMQDFVDMGISSTLNLPAWGTSGNNEDKVPAFAATVARFAPRLRGLTFYPDGSRGGQPLTAVPYREAAARVGEVYTEAYGDVCELTGKGGTCGA